MLRHGLRRRVPPQQDTKIVKPSNNRLDGYAIDEKDGHWRFVFAHMVKKHILNILRFFRSHGSSPTPFLEPSRPSSCRSARTRLPRCCNQDGRRARESQALHKVKQSRTVGEAEAVRAMGTNPCATYSRRSGAD